MLFGLQIWLCDFIDLHGTSTNHCCIYHFLCKSRQYWNNLRQTASLFTNLFVPSALLLFNLTIADSSSDFNITVPSLILSRLDSVLQCNPSVSYLLISISQPWILCTPLINTCFILKVLLLFINFCSICHKTSLYSYISLFEPVLFNICSILLCAASYILSHTLPIYFVSISTCRVFHLSWIIFHFLHYFFFGMICFTKFTKASFNMFHFELPLQCCPFYLLFPLSIVVLQLRVIQVCDILQVVYSLDFLQFS